MFICKIIFVWLFYCFIVLNNYSQDVDRCNTMEYLFHVMQEDEAIILNKNQSDNDIQEMINSSDFLNYQTIANASGFIYRIPVVVHIIGDAAISKVNYNKVVEQINILNQDFRKISGTPGDGNGVDSDIEFCLATLDPDGNATTGVTSISGNYGPYSNFMADDISLKSLSNWPADEYLNIWVCSLQTNLLGWGTFPWMHLDTENEFRDGVVIGINYFGNTSDPEYNRGRTLTHEVGHWLNLNHTWGYFSNGADGDCSVDDEVDDTPICTNPFFPIRLMTVQLQPNAQPKIRMLA